MLDRKNILPSYPAPELTVNSRGIGLESSLLFASEGANVVLVDINVANAEKVVELITQRFKNVKAVATKADVGKEADVKAAVDLAIGEFGRLDVMVRLLSICGSSTEDSPPSSITRVSSRSGLPFLGGITPLFSFLRYHAFR